MYKFGLIGFPITHSLSPWIHEEFLRRAKLKGKYSIFEIHPNESFAKAINHLKEQGIHGFNVTVPYKQKIIEFLDDIDSEAEKIGAVNTVVHKNGKWIGYNTDGNGYLRALTSKYPNIIKENSVTKRVLILGAGGAARGIYYAMMMHGFKNIDIANRTKKSAHSIAELKDKHTDTAILSLTEAKHGIDTYDIIIQTTSVGMNPKVNESIIQLKRLKQAAIVSDIVYQPIETKFLKDAKLLGANIHFGHAMLLYQAQYAFEIWTNKQLVISDMEVELEQKLKGR